MSVETCVRDEAQAPKRAFEPLKFESAADLYAAARRGEQFVLHYHERTPSRITHIRLGDGSVWVQAGPMLPVHIRPDGSSKDGPGIWLAVD